MKETTSTKSGSFELQGEDIHLAGEIEIAISELGLWDGTRFRCPSCGTSKPGKTKIFHQAQSQNRGVKCYKCGFSAHNAYSLLYQVGGLRRFQARPILKGETHMSGETRTVAKPKRIEGSAQDAFEPVIDSEVLVALAKLGDIDAAKRFWGRFFLAENVVASFAATRITMNVDDVVDHLVDQFGIQRLHDCGFAIVKDERIVWTVLRNGRPTSKRPMYPILQFHLDQTTGKPVGLEARGSEWVEAVDAAHKQGEVDDVKVEYMAKTKNLRGNPKQGRVGFGVHHVARFTKPGDTVLLVEGLKDTMAAWTMGKPAVGLPGSKAELSQQLLDALQGRVVRFAFDADEGGDAGVEHQVERLKEAGIVMDDTPVPYEDGEDMTDMLMRLVAHDAFEVPDHQRRLANGWWQRKPELIDKVWNVARRRAQRNTAA